MRSVARDGVPAVATDGEGGWNLYLAFRRVCEDSGGDAVMLYQAGRLPPHAQCECRELRSLGGEKVEEVPLRHKGNEFCVCGQVRKIGQCEGSIANTR